MESARKWYEQQGIPDPNSTGQQIMRAGAAWYAAHGIPNPNAQTPAGTIPAPYKPPIPAGYYDPSLDAQRDAASRGLLNTEQDIGLAGRRAQEDYGFDPNDQNYAWSQRGQIDLGYGRGMEDATRGRDRGLEDIGTQSRYEGEDYARNVGLLTRQFGQIARQQGEQARKYGVTSGGIALQSAAKRAENQGIEQQALDIAHRRAGESFATGRTRLGEDYTTTTGRLGVDRTNALGQAGMNYDRGVADRGTALGRARQEDLFYGLDIDALKRYQAKQAGWGV